MGSLLWKYFRKVNAKSAVCLVCKLSVMTAGNTTNLRSHLKNNHKKEFNEMEKQPVPGRKRPANSTEEEPNSNTDSEMENETEVNRSSSEQKQVKVSEFAQPLYNKSHPRKKHDRLLVNMIATDMQPLSLVKNTGFQQFCRALNPSYTLPSVESITRDLLPTYYQQEKEKFSIQLGKAHYVALTTDAWTSRSTEGYMAVTVHFIHEFKMHSRVISTKKIEERHPAETLKRLLLEVAEEWKIKEKVVAVVTDNASNIKKAVNDAAKELKSGWRHVSCFAHTLNLVVRAAIDEAPGFNPLLSKCRDVVNYFHRSVIAADKLRSNQLCNGQVVSKKLKADVATRWNSLLLMVKSLLDVKDAVSSSLAMLGKLELLFTEDEWESLRIIIVLLRPFDEVTVEVSAEKYPSISKVLPLTKILIRHLNSISSETCDTPAAEQLRLRLICHMKDRLQGLEQVKPIAVATYLDPRFRKAYGYISQDAVSSIEARIARELDFLSTSVDAAEITEAMASSNNLGGLWGAHDELVGATEGNSSTTAAAEGILNLTSYNREKPVARTTDPLVWWKTHYQSRKVLAEVALKFLCVPATSVPSERVFSKAGQLISERRNRLKGDNIDMLLFLGQ
jgi:hypothetical protein